MVRLELMVNRTLEEDFHDRLKKREIDLHYTKLVGVQGAGAAGLRRGDPVWPEENFLLICYCEEDQAQRLKDVVEGLKRDFPNEGIAMFSMEHCNRSL